MKKLILIIALCFCLGVSVNVYAGMYLISDSDFVPLTGNEQGSGLGTLDMTLFASATASNSGSGFDGDDACTDMPAGGEAVVSESYMTSMGEIREFYRLNFPDGQGGSTTNAMILYLDLNTNNATDVSLNSLNVVVDYDPTYGDGRDDPWLNDIPSASQNSTEWIYSGGTMETYLSRNKLLPVTQQGSGWADYGIVIGINPFDSRYLDSTRVMFNWSSGRHTTGGDEVFLSGEYAKEDVAPIPEPATIILLGMGGLALLKKRR